MNDFQIKLKKIPKEVAAYLTSMKATDFNILISEKYKISEDKIIDFTRLISQLYFKELSVDNLEKEIISTFGLNSEKAKKLTIDIVGIRLLVVDKWLKGQASDFLRKEKINPSEFKKYVDEQKKSLTEEEKYFTEQISEDPPYISEKKKSNLESKGFKIDLTKEKSDSLEIFKKDFSDILRNYDSLYLGDYNLILVRLIVEDLFFRDKLLKSLLENKEKLTFKKFRLDNNPVRPTIGNWLKDFSRSVSSEFNNLALVNYLVNSSNAKRLNDEEKNILKRLLLIFINLKNFEKNNPRIPLTEWEVFPRKKRERVLDKKEIKTQKQAKVNKPIDSIQPNPQIKAKPQAPNQAKNSNKLAVLQKMAQEYPEGSLERKAIKEEIRKL